VPCIGKNAVEGDIPVFFQIYVFIIKYNLTFLSPKSAHEIK